MTVPHHYAAAPQLSASARAALAGARLTWDEITKREREALTGTNAMGYVVGGRVEARERLRLRGLVTRSGKITNLGSLVREVGIAARVEVPHV